MLPYKYLFSAHNPLCSDYIKLEYKIFVYSIRLNVSCMYVAIIDMNMEHLFYVLFVLTLSKLLSIK